MKRYVTSAKAVTITPSQSLESFVGEEFDLNNEEVQYMIADWTVETFMDAISKNRKLKKFEFWPDDIRWSSSVVAFEIMEGSDNYCDTFTGRLNWYDADSENYEDVESILLDTIKDKISDLAYEYR